jgi:hypothetical protein
MTTDTAATDSLASIVVFSESMSVAALGPEVPEGKKIGSILRGPPRLAQALHQVSCEEHKHTVLSTTFRVVVFFKKVADG